ncbi:NADP-dependent oxidoreductase domain-containing protein [Naematelia encephala]|uniref:NADP-dependent oxidoreductase domain-containing protein n=1 Tax=Naematelia encephala TaxID=71784 RepID=A0A1Y2AZZ3_9TREE|nr:NADP-dependent oxidoreductase domain-containing protein [Naematelia encephala]
MCRMVQTVMPNIMYGTAWKKERTTKLVAQAVESGFRGIDTACQPKHYREDLVGEAIANLISAGTVKRQDLFIQTKFTGIDGQDASQPLPYDPRQSITDQVTKSIEKSLQNLRVEYIDSVLLHSPLRTKHQTLEAYRTLEKFVDDGRVRALGVSNCYDPALLEWLINEARIKVGVVQNRWYEGNGWDWDIYDICQENGIRYQSFWTLSGSPTLLRHPVLQSLAKKSQMTPQQTVYKLCQLWNITPLCGSTTPAHVHEALSVERSHALKADDEEVRTLLGLMRGET